jgi:hypothetical protein
MQALSWIGVLVLCFICFILAWIPCVIEAGKDVTHTCQHCGAVVGQKKAL